MHSYGKSVVGNDFITKSVYIRKSIDITVPLFNVWRRFCYDAVLFELCCV